MLTDARARTTELALATDGEGDWRRKISLIGSTGSIGTQTLDIVRARPDRFEVTLAAGRQVGQLAEQSPSSRRQSRSPDQRRELCRAQGRARRGGVSGVECVGE